MSRRFTAVVLATIIYINCGEVLAEEYSIVISRTRMGPGRGAVRTIFDKDIDLTFKKDTENVQLAFDNTYTLIVSTNIFKEVKSISVRIEDTWKVSLFSNGGKDPVFYGRSFHHIAIFNFNDSVIGAHGKGGLYNYQVMINPKNLIDEDN
ncbi:hypothetical protein [Rubinisphaera sp.]|uniref:hypothetical protein n=1 Tax=Rubinisphaera sp. TaxID=2024857 RepID=UPI000C0E49D7|nr:hypothetical protein [Rubinisphaera sp.]MBV11372.1 hypothetical protein [Rubinisphaera sp.]HCS52400.1 hypothetical protein [Planctomycetaceae bacterium]|tara:strand:+ start:89 stop:538 length:450 start_codon:yes stop_codon:yes gene_type:complete